VRNKMMQPSAARSDGADRQSIPTEQRRTKMATSKIALVTLVISVLMNTANAETPSERCMTNGVVNVTTLPVNTDKMWHQSNAPRVIWFKLPKGVHIDPFASYHDKAGIEWAWGSAGDIPEYGDAIVTGWIKHSSVKCK
jgi:hypothetical protein